MPETFGKGNNNNGGLVTQDYIALKSQQYSISPESLDIRL